MYAHIFLTQNASQEFMPYIYIYIYIYITLLLSRKHHQISLILIFCNVH
jgi:hypothetical protein